MTQPASLPLSTPLAAAERVRAASTCVLPSLAVFAVVLSGLWMVPDTFFGMYGNHDGHWASWSVRGILEWSEFFDFSPFSPLTGTGSLFLPNLPWLNPGAWAMAIPAPLALRHLASMLVYLAELSASLYLLYRHLEFSRAHAYLATLLYVCFFFIPLNSYSMALPWYALAPMNAHLVAAMNIATIALIRVGRGGLGGNLISVLILAAALLAAFTSAPVTILTYVPAYAVLWLVFLVPSRTQRRAVLWRWGAIAFALLALGLIGAPQYLAALAMTSSRGAAHPAFLHPGWQLLSPAYWHELVSGFSVCSPDSQLMCPATIVGWLEISILAGAACLVATDSGVRRKFGIAIVALLLLIHLYALLGSGQVLGRLGVLSWRFLIWAFFPLAMPAAIACAAFLLRCVAGRRAVRSPWAPAAANCLLAAVAVYLWFWVVLAWQPRVAGPGPLGLPAIAHVPAGKGPVVDYLQQTIGIRPGSEFRGYASTFLGAPDGLVRGLTATPPEIMTWAAYIAARKILTDRFRNSFQMMDLWNSGIPTIEEYSQSVSKQMVYFSRDLLAEPQDHMDVLQSSIGVYRFRPQVLRALGARFVIADGTLADPSVRLVMTERGKDGGAVNLYEIDGANRGDYSPTEVTWTADYAAAVSSLREQPDLHRRVILLGALEGKLELVAASGSKLVAVRDGYRLTASAPGTALLVLPVQFSHCWRIDGAPDAARIVRANIVQTGVVFRERIDARLRFDFAPWNPSCRLQDARDLAHFQFK